MSLGLVCETTFQKLIKFRKTTFLPENFILSQKFVHFKIVSNRNNLFPNKIRFGETCFRNEHYSDNTF